MGHPTYLRSKEQGENSMLEKRKQGEGAEPGVPQDPRDMVKAGLLESQSQAFICATAGIASDNGAAPCSEFGIGLETTSEWRAAGNEPDQGMSGAPKSC